MSKINALCVYCGSSPGTDPAFTAAAQTFGKILAKNDVRLVYGGGSVGLMGALAHSVLDHGGEVTGVIPEFLLKKERAARSHPMIITRDMHERKRKMFEMADAFVALPGGIGTLEELIELLTWGQLGRHSKPVLIANINGFWDPLLSVFEQMEAFQFIHSKHRFVYHISKSVKEILPTLSRAAGLMSGEQTRGESPIIDRM